MKHLLRSSLIPVIFVLVRDLSLVLGQPRVFSFTPRRGTSCRPSEFHCGNGTCIPEEWVCDRDSNCVDGSDESDSLCDTKKHRRVCYYTNWAQYREAPARFTPEDINPDLCTHLIYAFAELRGAQIETSEWNDPQMYERFNRIKNKNREIKTLLAVGGWNAGSGAFSSMVASTESRLLFVNSAIDFLRKYDFDGLDLDWEYPTRRGGRPEDKENFAKLVKLLREAFDREARRTGRPVLLLSAAVPTSKELVDQAYDIITLGKYLDFINLMTYDFHGGWESTVGHNSPLYSRRSETEAQRRMNTNWAARYWNQNGVPKDKLNIGIATYGRSYTLADPQTDRHIGASALAPGRPGQYTRETGFLSYYEICQMQDRRNGKIFRDEEQSVPYYVTGNTWVGYDDIYSVKNKAKWILQEGYGGSMVWSLSLDDFNKMCSTSSRTYPLTSLISETITNNRSGEMLTTTTTTTTPSSTTTSTSTTVPTTTNEAEITTSMKTTTTTTPLPSTTTTTITTTTTARRIPPTPPPLPPIPEIRTTVKEPSTLPPINPVDNGATGYRTLPPSVNVTSSTESTTKVVNKVITVMFINKKELPLAHRTTNKVVTQTPPTTVTTGEGINFGEVTIAPTPRTTKRPTRTITTTKRPMTTKRLTTAQPIGPFNPNTGRNGFLKNSPLWLVITERKYFPRYSRYFSCHRRRNGYYVDVHDCSKYYVCQNRRTFHYKCPKDLYYNPRKQICDWISQVSCVNLPQERTILSTQLVSGMARILLTFIYLTYLCHTAALKYKRVCYYTNWAQYRNGLAKFDPKHIDPSLCTHIAYAFGKLENNKIINFEWNDGTKYAEVNAVKRINPGLKTLLAMGGWTAGSKPYSDMAASPANRRTFIQSAISWLRKYDFDGLDMDWEYPANRGGAPEDFNNFPILLRESMEAFKEEAKSSNKSRLLLTTAVGVGKSVADTAYNIPEMSKYLDFISLMAYDLRGGWEKATGFNAALYKPSADPSDEYNVAFAVDYWLNKGAPKEKLILGLATYGRSFNLQDQNNFGVGAPATGSGPQGKYVPENGFLPYYEICERQIQKVGKTYRDLDAQTPFFVQEKLWVGFDDQLSIFTKINDLVIKKQLGGAMIWALDFDDFNNICGYGKYPISRVMTYTLLASESGVSITPPSTHIPLSTVGTTSRSPHPPPTGDGGKTPDSGGGGSGHDGITSLDVDCSKVADGTYRYSSDCSKYIQCVKRNTFVRVCPSGLEFSIATSQCDWPSNVDCTAIAIVIVTSIPPSSTSAYFRTDNSSLDDTPTNTGVLLSSYTPFVAMFCYIFRILCPILYV
ncbi:uncharacterized protein LOC128164955 [Crassostrea angulata]|uniref:uncharacterized protein LOC128164955 n=1 Tax=Magallana angulata TaxID=2784310 RepID=UPI0022B0D70E|nr:uncharacterized protein LOC128164955 [Crassostrea angulata]